MGTARTGDAAHSLALAGTIQAIACIPAAGAGPGARSDPGGIAASIQPPGQGGVPQVAWSAGKPGDGKSS
jgi:hypothetical protein